MIELWLKYTELVVLPWLILSSTTYVASKWESYWEIKRV